MLKDLPDVPALPTETAAARGGGGLWLEATPGRPIQAHRKMLWKSPLACGKAVGQVEL